MSAPVEASPRFRVCAAYVTCKIASGDLVPGSRGGVTILGFYRDSILPPAADPVNVAYLVEAGLVEEVPAGG